jgi:hypothetical protein
VHAPSVYFSRAAIQINKFLSVLEETSGTKGQMCERGGAIIALHGANDAPAAWMPTPRDRRIGSYYQKLMQLPIIWHKDWNSLTK